MQKPSPSLADGKSEQHRLLVSKYRSHLNGDWSDGYSTEKELIRQASEMISTGDEPLWSMQRTSLEEVIIAMSDQRNQMDRLLDKISKAINKKQQNHFPGRDRQMEKLVSDDLPDNLPAKKGHLAEQLADKMKQMADVNERFIEQQLKDIKQLDYELKKQEEKDPNERTAALDEQINELQLQIEKELHGITQLNAKNIQINETQPTTQLPPLDDSQKKILQETESNLARAKGLNQKLQERTLRVESDILSTQMELMQLKEYQKPSHDLQNYQTSNSSVSPKSTSKRSKSPNLVKQITHSVSITKRYAEKFSRKEILEKQISGNEHQTTVNLKRYEKLIGYLQSKAHQNSGLIEQFKTAMDNARLHLLRVSQLAAALDELSFKTTFPQEFKSLQAYKANHNLNGTMSYWELKTHSPSQQQALLSMSFRSDDEDDDQFDNQSNRLLEKSDSKRRSLHLHRKNDLHGQQQIVHGDQNEVIKRQQSVLEQLQLQLLDQTKQSDLLQLQLQMQQHSQKQYQTVSSDSEKHQKLDFYGGTLPKDQQHSEYESFRKSNLKLPKLGDEREAYHSLEQQQHRRDNQSQLRQQQFKQQSRGYSQDIEDSRFHSASVANHHLLQHKIQPSRHEQSQNRSQSVVQQPAQRRHLRINTHLEANELYDFNPKQQNTTPHLQSTFVYNNQNNPALSRSSNSYNTNNIQQLNTISSLNNDDGMSRQQELSSNCDENNDDNTSSQMDIFRRRSSSQKRMLRRKNNNGDFHNNEIDSTLSLIDASSSPVKQQELTRNSNEYNAVLDIIPNGIAPGMINSNNDKSLVLQGLPGTRSSFSSIVWQATEKKKQQNYCDDNESQETRNNKGQVWSDNRKITDMNDTLQLSKYMDRGLNEQALSYKPTGKNSSLGTLNQSYGVVTRVSPERVDQKLNRISITSLQQAHLEQNQEKQHDQNRSFNRLGQQQEVRIRENSGDKDKNENNTLDVGRSVEISRKLLESSSSGNHKDNNNANNHRLMKSTLSPFIEKRYIEGKGNGMKNLKSYAAFNENGRGLRRKMNYRSSQGVASGETDDSGQRMEGERYQRNKDNSSMAFNQQESQYDDDGRDERQEILKQLAEERSEKGKLKEILKREENEKEMLIQQLQQQQRGQSQEDEQFSQQNETELASKDRRINRGKVTWKDSERGSYLNHSKQLRDFDEGSELRYASRSRGQADSYEKKGQGDQELQKQQLHHYGSNLSPKSSLKWRRSQQLLENQQSPISQNNQAQKSSEIRKRSSYGFKQASSSQQVSEFVSFLDAQRALQGQSKEEEEYCRYDTNQNDVQKSPLRNRMEKKQVNFKQLD